MYWRFFLVIVLRIRKALVRGTSFSVFGIRSAWTDTSKSQNFDKYPGGPKEEHWSRAKNPSHEKI